MGTIQAVDVYNLDIEEIVEALWNTLYDLEPESAVKLARLNLCLNPDKKNIDLSWVHSEEGKYMLYDMLEELFMELNKHAPQGYYFSKIPGVSKYAFIPNEIEDIEAWYKKKRSQPGN